MTNTKPNPGVDRYIADGCGRCPLVGTPDCKVQSWQEELATLREILLASELQEEVKWSVPCYTFEGSNILLMSSLKDYCSLDFFKGVLLRDPHRVLIQQTENVQAGRQLRFTDVQQVIEMKPIIEAYIREAIEIEKSGLKVEYKKTEDFDYPDELLAKIEDDPAFREAFEALTPGRQRGYLLYFAAPKQSKTRVSRIEKYTARIFDGKGLHDR